MHDISISLPEMLYSEAERRAKEEGFASVSDFLLEVVTTGLTEPSNMDHVFTPERLERIDLGFEDVKSGKVQSSAEVLSRIAEAREQWLKKQSG